MRASTCATGTGAVARTQRGARVPVLTARLKPLRRACCGVQVLHELHETQANHAERPTPTSGTTAAAAAPAPGASKSSSTPHPLWCPPLAATANDAFTRFVMGKGRLAQREPLLTCPSYAALAREPRAGRRKGP